MSEPLEPLDLRPSLRDSIIDEPLITELLSQWGGEPAVFTRRPVPHDAEDPLIILNAPFAITDQDALNSERPVWSSDIAIYGRKGQPGSTEDQTREVEAIGFRIRALFHRQRFSVSNEGFSVIDVTASGPVAGPVDDDKTVARIVSLRIRLRRN